MRPKLIALLAVSAVALVGCAAGEPSVEPTATVTVTATPEPVMNPASTGLPPEVEATEAPRSAVEYVEHAFVATTRIQSKSLEVPLPADQDVIDALHAFCEDGTPMKLSPTEKLNDNLESIASSNTCDQIDEATN